MTTSFSTAAVASAPPAPPAIWTVADLDAALFACIDEPWADQVILKVLRELVPLLEVRGFTCAAPDEPLCNSDFAKDFAVMNASRSFAVVDPIGASDEQRLQATVSLGFSARLGASRTHRDTGRWVRSVRACAFMSVALGYASTKGKPLFQNPQPLAAAQLNNSGEDLMAANVSDVVRWWQSVHSVEALSGLISTTVVPRQQKPFIQQKNVSMLELLENMVERGLVEMVP
jgi:hypothetical protein